MFNDLLEKVSKVIDQNNHSQMTTHRPFGRVIPESASPHVPGDASQIAQQNLDASFLKAQERNPAADADMSPGKRSPQMITSPLRSKGDSEISYDFTAYRPIKSTRLWGNGPDTARVDPYADPSTFQEPPKTGDG